jgi:H+/Cl- antiporter ClcA
MIKKLSLSILFGAVVGAASGAASAVFLWLLAEATTWRVEHEAIVFALPAAGAAIGLVYARWGRSIKAGNNLVIDTIHDGGPELPFRMLPMVLVGTVLTHLFGGSAGREGTAVQMGASMADWLSHRVKLDPDLRRQLLAAGVAGGFGSVFGTPFAGAMFGMEFVRLGRIEYRALVPTLIAALLGDQVTRHLGIVHASYPELGSVGLTQLLVGKWLVVAVAVAAACAVFIELTHFLKRRSERFHLSLRMAIGGAIVVGLWQLVGSSEYLGLGVPTIVSAFDAPQPAYVFALKILFTAITLGAGFLGGEVTPLFFIGATLGAALAPVLGIPQPLAAGVCLAAVFGAASNTPIALSIMAVELLGTGVLLHVAIVSAVAHMLVGRIGRRSIYPAQLGKSAPPSEPN